MKKVLVLGGGFAGVDAAIHLTKKHFDVTLVSDRDYFYIYPTSIWVPVNKVTFSDICVNLHDIKSAYGFNVIVDSVVAINAAQKAITLASKTVLDDFDYIVIAMGAGKMQHNGLEHTLSICAQPEVSLDIKKRLEQLIEKGSANIAFGFGGNPKDTTAVRGGPAFELLFNVHEMLVKKGVRDKFKLTMFAPMPKPGARMGEKALVTMKKMFQRANIEQAYGKKIKAFVEDGVIFEDDSKLESDFTMFIPAGNGHDVMKESDLPLSSAGFIEINDFCEVKGLEGIYAVGDVAYIEGPEWRAKQGHVAEVMAKCAAHNIALTASANIKGQKEGYQKHLNILCVMDTGNGAGFIYRDSKRAMMLPMPIVGHWLKQGWGYYCKNSKLGKIPRVPGM